MDHQPTSTAEPPAMSKLRQALGLAIGAALILALSVSAGWWLRQRRDRPPSVASAEPSPRKGGGERGKLLYEIFCLRCHGPEGRGDGAAALGMSPTPGDWTAGEWKHGGSLGDIRRVIHTGIPGTAMIANPSLSDVDLDALAAHVVKLADRPELAATIRTAMEKAGFVPVDRLRSAPPLEVRDSGGARCSLADLRGRVVLINFWGSTCAHCLGELPALERLARAHADGGVTVLSVCHDEPDPARVAAIARRHAPRLSVHADPEGRGRLHYDVTVMPSVYLIDPHGRLVGRAQGVRNWGSAEMRALLDAVNTSPERQRRVRPVAGAPG